MNAFEKWSVWVTTVLTGVTGAGYFWTKYLTEPAGGQFAVVNHPLEPWFLKAHILVSPLLLFAVGTILVRHVWRHFRKNVSWGRRSGLVTALVLAPMVVTGYLIQVITAAGWVRAMAISHIVLGFVFLAGIAVHQAVTHRPPSGEAETPGPSRRRRARDEAGPGGWSRRSREETALGGRR